MQNNRKKIRQLTRNRNIKFESEYDRKLRIEKQQGIVRVERRTEFNQCKGKIINF